MENYYFLVIYRKTKNQKGYKIQVFKSKPKAPLTLRKTAQNQKLCKKISLQVFILKTNLLSQALQSNPKTT